nr:unnamed protein product [Callosobruchus chinensis]
MFLWTFLNGIKEADSVKMFAIDDPLVQFGTLMAYILVGLLFVIVGFRPPWWSKKSSHCDDERSTQNIPGPIPVPILGTSWTFIVGPYSFSRIHEFYADMHRRYGAICKEEALFNVHVFNVFEKADIEKVLRSGGGKFPMRPPIEAIVDYRRSRPDRYASAGLVNEQGEAWHFLRNHLTSDLTSPKTISCLLPQVHEIADDWCNLIRSKRDSKCVVSALEGPAMSLGLESSCALVLGRRLGFLASTLTPVVQELSEAVCTHFLATRDTYYGLPWWRLFATPAYRQLARSEDKIYTLAAQLMRTDVESIQRSPVLKSVMNAPIDDKEKIAALIDFIAAGIYTLKNSLIFLLYLVASNPGVQEKILEDSSKSYVKACISEAFRLIPTAFCLARITNEPLNLSGYAIEPGSVVVCHTGIACKNDENFPNANEFRPERWLGEERQKTLSNATFLVTPFGVGKRMCPGRRFIEQVLPVFLETIVRNFEMEVVNKLELQFEFLLAPKGPTSMVFKDRDLSS